ncbi:2-oxo acid dehydrogenase subunit E2 [Streptomyces sp. FH025]|uniref:2-oxo acid dehydrogenase subunit E2 n=1 Tax=Streptomyces sp. FH025 TaxID=2815937 RepID=UPI001A9F9CD6|nr:2-oxo acid dehydrogenase subunit E2 [Streptomyces sp. FH025]MBO1413053.1 2-oxo acid dehydrogenase subunit E2 [Streptomyces sp. FH025]
MSVVLRDLPAARRGTWTFLHGGARRTCHVYLDTDVDATLMRDARTASDGRIGYVSMVVKAAADVVADYPDARALLQGGALRPRLAVTPGVSAKVLLDKTVDGQRCVVSGTVPDAGAKSTEQIQAVVDTYKDAPVDDAGPYRQMLKLQRMPLPLSRLVYRAALRDPVKRAALQGTFSVTSVGREPVRAIYPMISGTLGFGIGRIVDTPVARAGDVVIAPLFTLSLAFDHRVLDGALASEVLGRVKDRLESWKQD